MNVIDKARLFAIAAHSAIGQVRKYSGEPYWQHPERVANILRTVAHDDNMIAAAYLHDVLEDTKVTKELLQQEFGDRITTMVVWLTDISKPSDGNRETRKRIDREHIRNAPPVVHTIKLCDVIDNCKSIGEHDPEFAVIYFNEKRQLLEVLSKGDHTLFNIALETINAIDTRTV